MTDALDREIAHTAAACDAELTHMAKRAVVAELAGDLVERVRDVLDEHIYVCALGVCGQGDAARAVLALFQPRMEAAERLLLAVDAVKKRGLYEHELIPALWAAADKARAAGLGRESHD